MHDDVDAFIEPIVEAAQIPSRRRRDQLRRELRSHFEEAGLGPQAFQEAVARFGNTAGIGDSLRKVYRREYAVFYLVKLAASLAAAVLAAILIEAVANLRLEGNGDAWQLSPGFAHAVGLGVVLTVALVAGTEASRAPFTWMRALVWMGGYSLLSACAWALHATSVSAFVTSSILAAIGVGFARASTSWSSRALLTLGAFAAAEYLRHQSLGIAFGPLRALTASAVLLVLWASTLSIVSFSDRAFVSTFRTS